MYACINVSQTTVECLYIYIHTYIHTHTHSRIHTYIHTHIHTYIHSYTYVHRSHATAEMLEMKPTIEELTKKNEVLNASSQALKKEVSDQQCVHVCIWFMYVCMHLYGVCVFATKSGRHLRAFRRRSFWKQNVSHHYVFFICM